MNAARTTRTLLLPALAAASLACQPPEADRAMPSGQLYFPSGMFFARSAAPGTPERSGALFVASSNFDRRYDNGRLTGIDVASLVCAAGQTTGCIPDFPGAGVSNYPLGNDLPLDSLVGSAVDEKDLASLAGEMDGIERTGGGFRLLVPSRAEGSPLQLVETSGHQISCHGGDAKDCSVGAISLEANRNTEKGVPRLPAPFSISIDKRGAAKETFITSLQPADSPPATGQNLTMYTVALDAAIEDPQQSDLRFIPLGNVRTESVVVGSRYAFMTGAQSLALRLIDRPSIVKDPLNDAQYTARTVNPAVEANINLLDTRGLALSADEREVFVATRSPDALLVLRMPDSSVDAPSLSLTHVELLPLGASQVRVADKPLGGHVAFVTSVGTQSADATGQTQGALLIYDDESAQPVATLDGFGFSPYGLALQTISPGVRVYVGLFGEGRIAVVDIPDLEHPEEARLVARLGTSTICVTNPSSRGCAALNALNP